MLLICTHHGIGFVCEVSALGHFKSIARSALCLNDRTLVDRTRSRNLDGTVVAQRQRTGIGDLAGGKRTRNGSCTGSLDGGQFAGGQFARNVKRAGIDSCRFNGKLRTTSDRVGAARCVRLTSLEGADNNAFSLQVAALRDVAALRKDAARKGRDLAIISGGVDRRARTSVNDVTRRDSVFRQINLGVRAANLNVTGKHRGSAKRNFCSSGLLTNNHITFDETKILNLGTGSQIVIDSSCGVSSIDLAGSFVLEDLPSKECVLIRGGFVSSFDLYRGDIAVFLSRFASINFAVILSCGLGLV